jgi:hypothetical protein
MIIVALLADTRPEMPGNAKLLACGELRVSVQAMTAALIA